MTTALVLSLIAGAVLGCRYRAFVIVPAALAVATIVATVQIFSGETIGISIGTAALGWAALQLGYMASSVWVIDRQARGHRASDKLRLSDPLA